MPSSRRWHSRASSLCALVVWLLAGQPGVSMAQGASGRGASPLAAGESGRVSSSQPLSGRGSSSRFVPISIANCASADLRCRVAKALTSRPVPDLFARGEDLRALAPPGSQLVVFICPCGKACLRYPDYGWSEQNFGWGGASGQHAADVVINFHRSQSTNTLLSTQPQLSFRIKWSRSADGTGSPLLSEEIITYGARATRPPVIGTCRE